MQEENINNNHTVSHAQNSFGFHSPSFVFTSLAEDGPAVDAPEADGSDASSLLLLLGGGPGRAKLK